MSEQKHAPEPWAYFRVDAKSVTAGHYEPYSPFVAGAGPRLVCVDRSTFIHADDYARIVACVNACAGMIDPAAELEQLRAENAELKKAQGEPVATVAGSSVQWIQPAAAIGDLLNEFPLFDEAGLDENEHCCEWTLNQDRKRLRAKLNAQPAPAFCTGCGERFNLCDKPAPAVPEGCHWRHDSDDYEGDSWYTSCGDRYCFTEGGPEENNQHFCHKCGRPVLPASPEQPK